MSWTSVSSGSREWLQCLLTHKGELKLQMRMTTSGHLNFGSEQLSLHIESFKLNDIYTW